MCEDIYTFILILDLFFFFFISILILDLIDIEFVVAYQVLYQLQYAGRKGW